MPRLSPLPAAIGALSDLHDQILPRSTLRDLGVSRHRVAHEVGARRWQTFGALAVVLHSGPPSQIQRARIAVIEAGPHAALGGISALQVAGLKSWTRTTISVVTHKSRNSTRLPFSTVHESRTLNEDHIRVARGLRICVPPRAAVDGAGWEPSVRSAIGLVAATVQQGLAPVHDIHDTLMAAGRIRHHRALLAALGDIAGGLDALSEIDLIKLCARYRLPAPSSQTRRRGADGRIRYLDASIDLPDGTILAIEVDGAVHLDPRAWWGDAERSNALVTTGVRLLRFPAWAVREQPDRVAHQLRAALVAFGVTAA